jgi:hypothetical protein
MNRQLLTVILGVGLFNAFLGRFRNACEFFLIGCRNLCRDGKSQQPRAQLILDAMRGLNTLFLHSAGISLIYRSRMDMPTY